MTKKTVGLFAAGLCLFLVLLPFAGLSHAQSTPIVLRGITPWTPDYQLSKCFFIFQQVLREQTKGELSVTYLGGPEVAPPFEQIEALRTGVVDVLLGVAAYYRAQVPEAAAIQLARLSGPELRKSGYYDLMRQIHLKKANVVYLAQCGGTDAFRLYSNVKLEKPDLSGMKIRVTPVYVPLVKALNGAPIMMAPAEIHTAMERRVVDGFGWTVLGITELGLHEVTKYVIEHPFYALDVSIMINGNVWNRLPQQARETLERIAPIAEARWEKFFSDTKAAEDKKLQKAGLQFLKFPPADAEKYVRTAYDEAWKAVNKDFPELGPRLRKLSEK